MPAPGWWIGPQEAWTRTLLALVPAKADTLEPVPHRYIDAGELLRRATLRTRTRAHQGNVALVVHCDCGSMCVQPEKFSDAIFHLLDNAIEATSPGSPVFVDARRSADGDILWQVVDTGRGMEPDALARLGDPRVAGPGRGVALANAVIQEHGGVLRFESAPRVGTTASIWLPAACACG